MNIANELEGGAATAGSVAASSDDEGVYVEEEEKQPAVEDYNDDPPHPDEFEVDGREEGGTTAPLSGQTTADGRSLRHKRIAAATVLVLVVVVVAVVVAVVVTPVGGGGGGGASGEQNDSSVQQTTSVPTTAAATATTASPTTTSAATAPLDLPTISPSIKNSTAQATNASAVLLGMQLEGVSEIMRADPLLAFHASCSDFFFQQLVSANISAAVVVVVDCNVTSQNVVQVVRQQRRRRQRRRLQVKTLPALNVAVQVSTNAVSPNVDAFFVSPVLDAYVNESGDTLLQSLVKADEFFANATSVVSISANTTTTTTQPSVGPPLAGPPTVSPIKSNDPVAMAPAATAAPTATASPTTATSVDGDNTTTLPPPTILPSSNFNNTKNATWANKIRDVIANVIGDDKLSDPASPYGKALKWITDEDVRQMEPEYDRQLTQRYLAAYFYFATSQKRPWASCGKAQEEVGETEDCIFKRIISISDPPGVVNVPWKRWLSVGNECTWAGVFCDKIGQFRSLEFAGMNMTGTFPEGVVYFPFLQSLSMAYSELEGPLPEMIADMKHLINFELNGNLFTGPIPERWYASRNLQRINLSVNQIGGQVSSAISKLKDLKGIFLFRNMLTGPLPDEIGQLSSSSFLHFGSNRLSGSIPSTFRNLVVTSDFWLSRNAISGSIPTEIGLMTALSGFHVSDNLLTGPIPEELYNLKNMFRMDLRDNQLTGTISSRISELTDLVVLQVNNNQLFGTIPTELGLLSRLESAVLFGNDFSGTVPDELCLLRLKELEVDCSSPQCTCCTFCYDGQTASPTPAVPANAVRNATAIRHVIESGIRANLTTGPTSPYSKALQWIVFDDPRQLTQEAPNLMQRFVAAYFYFATSVDQAWASCEPASDSDDCVFMERVSFRWLSSEWECSWAGVGCNGAQEIFALSLAEMNMTGTIPEGVVYFPSLQVLDLAGGLLVGTIPAALGTELLALEHLDLQNNQLTGVLPMELYNPRLVELLVGGNLLEGTIGTEIGIMSKLVRLAIGPSKMRGELPAELFSLPLEILHLHDSFFSGPLLEDMFMELSDTLVQLWLQNNMFSGPIPINAIENMVQLEHLLLAGNSELTGSITVQLCDTRGYGIGQLSELQVDCGITCEIEGCCDGHERCP